MVSWTSEVCCAGQSFPFHSDAQKELATQGRPLDGHLRMVATSTSANMQSECSSLAEPSFRLLCISKFGPLLSLGVRESRIAFRFLTANFPTSRKGVKRLQADSIHPDLREFESNPMPVGFRGFPTPSVEAVWAGVNHLHRRLLNML